MSQHRKIRQVLYLDIQTWNALLPDKQVQKSGSDHQYAWITNLEINHIKGILHEMLAAGGELYSTKMFQAVKYLYVSENFTIIVKNYQHQ